MKMLRKILPIVTLVVLITSCEDVIDITQPGELGTDIVFTNLDDLQKGLNSSYLGLNTFEAIQISSLFTDETALGIENSGQNIGLYTFIFNSSNAIPTNLWLNNYRTINGVNRALEAAAKLEVSDDEQERFEHILAQFYAIRAAEHFELLTYFSTDLTDSAELGVMKSDIVPLIDEQRPRVSNSDIFSLIESDLAKVREKLDPSVTNPFLITTGFIDALEARMALYRDDNALALTKAQKLIDNYPLASRTEYARLFRDQSTTGVIFSGERNQSTGSEIAGIFYFRQPNRNGGAFMEIGKAFFNKLDPTDVRYDVIVQNSSEITNNILLIGKYPGSDGAALVNDFKYFRVAEMYLIKAEAQAKTNDLSGAAATLKELRDARLVSPAILDNYATRQEALAAVLAERRIELAFEGHRYVDLKRLSNDAGSTIDRDPTECGALNACTLGANEFFKFTFPIPQDEINGNAAIRDQQNPGYE